MGFSSVPLGREICAHGPEPVYQPGLSSGELEGLLNEDAAEKAIGWMGKPRQAPWAGDKVFESSYVVSEQPQEGVWEA